MFDDDHSAKRLNTQQYWEVLAKAVSGTLAVSFAGQPDLFAVEFQVQEEKILVCTPQGEMLVQLTINPSVAFEVQGILAGSKWSVVVKGTARELQSWTEIHALQEKGLQPWSKDGVLVEITPTAVLGRRMKASSVQE